MDSDARTGNGTQLPALTPPLPRSVMGDGSARGKSGALGGARRWAGRIRNALWRFGRAAVQFRGSLVLTAIATGDGPNLALSLTGANRLCRRVRGIALQPMTSARRVRVRGRVRRGDGSVGLSIDLPPEEFLRSERRILDVVGWRGTIPVKLGDAHVLDSAGVIAPALAARWDIALATDERGRLILRARQPEHAVTAHEVVLDGERLRVGWERAAMTRELRLGHAESGATLTAPGEPVGVRSVATIALRDLCAVGTGRWTVQIGEPGGPWAPLVQDRALQVASGATRSVLAATPGTTIGPCWVRAGYSAAGLLSVRVEPATPEPSGATGVSGRRGPPACAP